MNERAKEVLLRLKKLDKEFSDSFEAYVDSLTKELEIPREIAVTLVTDECVNKYQRQLILHDLFSEMTLDKLNKR